MVRDLMRRGKRLIDYARKVKPDVLVGTSVDISYTGKLLGIPAINVNEDDADVVPMYARLAYPSLPLPAAPSVQPSRICTLPSQEQSEHLKARYTEVQTLRS